MSALGGFLTCVPGPPFIFSPVHSFLQSAQDCDASQTPVCFRALRTPGGAVFLPSQSLQSCGGDTDVKHTFFYLLSYSRFTVLCWSLPRSSVSQLCGSTYPRLEPASPPSHASRSSRSTERSSLCCGAAPARWLCYTR